MDEILKLTKTQVRFYLRFVRDYTMKELEYEEVPGTKEFMEQLRGVYAREGREMPPVE